jgi:hypothetical protein
MRICLGPELPSALVLQNAPVLHLPETKRIAKVLGSAWFQAGPGRGYICSNNIQQKISKKKIQKVIGLLGL